MLVLPVQAKDVADTPSSESNDSPVVSDLSVEQFSEVVKAIVQQTLEECAVEGDMEGKAKLNLDVIGNVTARIVCNINEDTEEE
jgi:CO/xanthine dehydrogenase FAD-binding subunit